MNRAYIIFAMKRTGHHAIVNWIGYNIPYGTVFYNDCCYGWDSQQLIPSDFQSDSSKQIAIGNVKDIRNVIYNIEDFDTDNLKKYDFLSFSNVVNYDEKYSILVIRDPWNWLASYLKMFYDKNINIDEKIKLYNKQIDYAIKNENIVINYNHWFTDKSYRENLSAILNLEPASINNGINKVSTRGGGSSFDKMKFKTNAQNMDVLNRWINYKSDNYFKDKIKLFSEESKNLFPDIKLKYEQVIQSV